MKSLTEITFNSDRVVDFLKRQLQFKSVCESILSQDVVEQAAQDRGIVVEPDEIQAEADRQRRQLQLENASDTHTWLEDQLITPDIWELGIRDRLLAKILAERLFDQDIEAYFAEHQLEFEQVTLYRILVPYSALAQELFYRIEEDEISFYEAAHLYDADTARRLKCGYEGRHHRWALPPQIAAVVFSRQLGELIGPVKSEQGYDLFLVEERVPAELTDEVRQVIRDRLFQSWLARELSYAAP